MFGQKRYIVSLKLTLVARFGCDDCLVDNGNFRGDDG